MINSDPRLTSTTLSKEMPKIMDGKKYAKEKMELIKARVYDLKNNYNITPGLAVILIGNDPASEIYVRNKILRAQEVGIKVFPYYLPNNITEQALYNLIDELNLDINIHAILLQLPLPSHLATIPTLNKIAPQKDVDGFSTISVGYLHMSQKIDDLQAYFVPCTPQGCLNLLKKYEPNLSGKHVIIVGRSNIVGKPMAALLLNENCTVTMCHSKTQNLQQLTSLGDIVVTAIGKPKFFKKEYFKEGVIILDVGINRVEEGASTKLVGDVDFENVIAKVKYISPVPGGIGPMTIVSLLENTCSAAEQTSTYTIGPQNY